jgi:predicted RNase H-like nuclease (RuvC/YqgF family)
MTQTIDRLTATITLLRDELKMKDTALTTLKDENTMLKKEVSNLKKCNDELEQYGRRDNLIITGLPSSYAEVSNTPATLDTNRSTYESYGETVHKVVNFLNDEMKIDIDESDISMAHRLPGTSSFAKPILVRFISRRARDAVYNARISLRAYNQKLPKGKGVYVNEDLSPYNRKIFQEAWRRKGATNGFERVYTSNCQVIVIKNSQKLRILSLDHLHTL